MNICFEGIGEVVATFCVKEDNELKAGQAVALVGSGEVGMGADGDALCGVGACAEKDGCAAVQIGGMCKVSFEGTAPAIGWTGISVDGTGKIKAAEGGMKCMVAMVDAASGTAIIKL